MNLAGSKRGFPDTNTRASACVPDTAEYIYPRGTYYALRYGSTN